MAPRSRSFRHLLHWLIAGSRGGVNRAKIISILNDEPMNANQLTGILEVDYRTVRHHLDVLEKNGVITPMGERYGMMYFLSPEMEENYQVFEEIWNRFGNKEKKAREE
ncbi:winged helix-turn-helix transcriptional regulator [Candidatus Bathyarchaeota archaeon]|nr:winged helix-turn-helix transcriptional regulator [Candidatus Bathyarchaeota archaeon]MBL7079740.1 winged helix-turn-helix transcriptional regulator [Candidatus Bathyarchaeota archaeon]